ncbi:MAG: tRNA pseudouridine(55) synthase TruB [Flavitalea sp.]
MIRVNSVFEDGMMLLIDKPYGWTSFDVVSKLRSWIKIKKIGHAGTLDPLATGLLILCTGKFTKKLDEYMKREKEYTGKIMLGATTATYDLESIPENRKDTSLITAEQVHAAASTFTGEILQAPPIYSAIKKDGRRAYELARKGVEVELEPRKVIVREFVTGTELPEFGFRVVCSTGTYIRSLANDLGRQLGCGGYLSSLCRTRIGEFKLSDAWTMEQAEERIKALGSKPV